MRKKLGVACAAALGLGAVVFTASGAQAATCTSTISGNPAFTATPTIVWIAGSTASQVPLQGLAPVLATKNIAIVYQAPDSCQGISDLIGGGTETKQRNFLDPNQVTNGLAKTVACDAESGTQPPIDIAPSDAFPETCAEKLGIGTPGQINTTSTGFRDFLGPAQAMTIAVNSGFTASPVISAQAAYVVFGFDANTYSVSPWTDAAHIFTRPYTSGTMNVIGAAIGLDPKKFANATPSSTPPAEQAPGTGNMLTDLSGTTAPTTSIGQLSYESIVTATNASSYKILAFQGQGQTCGYTPDSGSGSHDMVNVREGRYAIWGPLHFVVKVDSSGNVEDGTGALSPAVQQIMNYFIATGPNPPAASSSDAGVTATDIQTVVKAETTSYVVPWCAMHVIRTSEGGAEASYQSPTPCTCYYEHLLGVSNASYCSGQSGTCTSDSDCADAGTYSHCRFGYCEAN